jgi:hypothetical protein
MEIYIKWAKRKHWAPLISVEKIEKRHDSYEHKWQHASKFNQVLKKQHGNWTLTPRVTNDYSNLNMPLYKELGKNIALKFLQNLAYSQ